MFFLLATGAQLKRDKKKLWECFFCYYLHLIPELWYTLFGLRMHILKEMDPNMHLSPHKITIWQPAFHHYLQRSLLWHSNFKWNSINIFLDGLDKHFEAISSPIPLLCPAELTSLESFWRQSLTTPPSSPVRPSRSRILLPMYVDSRIRLAVLYRCWMFACHLFGNKPHLYSHEFPTSGYECCLLHY